MAAPVTFDPAAFRLLFPAFSANPPYTDVLLQGYFDSATQFIANVNSGCQGLSLGQLTLALNYMTAHLAATFVIIAAGDTPGQVQSATIDKVSVSMTPPPNKNQWAWWLGTTPYGALLLALLSVASVGGGYYGGRPEIGAMRKVGGIF